VDGLAFSSKLTIFTVSVWISNQYFLQFLAHYEAPPFAGGQQVSAYHVRAIEKFRLGLLADKKRKPF
jgi:hypothetical protein